MNPEGHRTVPFHHLTFLRQTPNSRQVLEVNEVVQHDSREQDHRKNEGSRSFHAPHTHVVFSGPFGHNVGIFHFRPWCRTFRNLLACKDGGQHNQNVHNRANSHDDTEDLTQVHQTLGDFWIFISQRLTSKGDIRVAALYTQCTGTHQSDREYPSAETEDIRLPFCHSSKSDLALEHHWNQPISNRHERHGCTNYQRAMEMARQVHGVVDNHVDLFHAHHHASNDADEAETNQRQEHAGENRVAPRRLTKPGKQTGIKTLPALSNFNGARNSQTVDHTGQHCQIEHVAGVEYLPGRRQPRIRQQVMHRTELQEQDIQQERATAHLL